MAVERMARAKGRHVPTVASGRLAAELRALREPTGLTHEAVAEEMGWAGSKMYRIENDKSRILPRDVKRLMRLYRVDDERAAAIVELAGQAREPEWWHQYSDALPTWFDFYLALETSASWVHGYIAELVPGILQTEGYMRALMSVATTVGTDQEIEQRIMLRTSRAARLSEDNPLEVWSVLNESVIRRTVGGPGVMADQLDHMASLARRRNVTLQVLPFATGAHVSMSSGFTLLAPRRAEDPLRVYLEQELSGLYVQKPDDVAWYARTFDHLRAQALSPEKSVELIRTTAKELGNY